MASPRQRIQEIIYYKAFLGHFKHTTGMSGSKQLTQLLLKLEKLKVRSSRYLISSISMCSV